MYQINQTLILLTIYYNIGIILFDLYILVNRFLGFKQCSSFLGPTINYNIGIHHDLTPTTINIINNMIKCITYKIR
jgi:hypothetical protein